jgi:hypothetical protein
MNEKRSYYMDMKNLAGMMNRRPGMGAATPNQRPAKTLGGSPAVSAPVKSAQPVASPQPVKTTPHVPDEPQTVGEAAAGLVSLIKDMTGGFAVLSDKVLQQNIEMMMNPDIPLEDRTISLFQLDYLATHVAHILMGLVFEDKFRQTFVDALNIEIKLDEETPEDRRRIRAGFNLGGDLNRTGSITLGLTELSASARDAVNAKVAKSFDMMEPFKQEFDAAVGKLAIEKRVELGFIFSNFMYLLRAFAQNEVFFSYVTNVVDRVKESLTPDDK